MDDFIKELSTLNVEDMNEIIDTYEKLPDGILKSSMELSFESLKLIIKGIKKERHNN